MLLSSQIETEKKWVSVKTNNRTGMKFCIIKRTAGWLRTSNKKLSYNVFVHQLETDEEQWEPGVGVGCRLINVPVM